MAFKITEIEALSDLLDDCIDHLTKTRNRSDLEFLLVHGFPGYANLELSKLARLYALTFPEKTGKSVEIIDILNPKVVLSSYKYVETCNTVSKKEKPTLKRIK